MTTPSALIYELPYALSVEEKTRSYELKSITVLMAALYLFITERLGETADPKLQSRSFLPVVWTLPYLEKRLAGTESFIDAHACEAGNVIVAFT